MPGYAPGRNARFMSATGALPLGLLSPPRLAAFRRNAFLRNAAKREGERRVRERSSFVHGSCSMDLQPPHLLLSRRSFLQIGGLAFPGLSLLGDPAILPAQTKGSGHYVVAV